MTPEERFAEKTIRDGSCLRWTDSVNGRGYGTFYQNGKVQGAHRVAWEFANGPIPAGLFCCHSCDHPWCVEPTHLWLGTQTDNMRDMISKGRCGDSSRPGNVNGHAKITEDDVRAIRKAAEPGESKTSISRRYPISISMVCCIVRRESWTHIK